MDIVVHGVPFDGWGRQGHQGDAARVLREAGLVSVLADRHAVTDAGDLELPGFDAARGPLSGLVNEPALIAMTQQLADRIAAATGAGRIPVVVGGDCSLLLGVVTGIRDALGPTGLLFVDGHEDAMPLDVSEDGEAANTEIGLLLGLTGRTLTGPLAAGLPAMTPEHLAMVGQRDEEWRRRFNLASLAGLGVWSRAWVQLDGDAARAGAEAARHLVAAAGRWWLHVDLDVLDPVVFPAQGVPGDAGTPGGLRWEELHALLESALAVGGCAGFSVTIYDPAQDPDRDGARQIVELLRRTVGAVSIPGGRETST